MNYGSLRHYLNLRYMKAADDGGAGGGGISSGSDAGGPSPGGDGGGSSVPTPSDGGGTPTPPSPDSNPWDNLGSSEDLDHIEIPPAAAQPAPTPSAQPATPVQPAPAQAQPAPQSQQTPAPAAQNPQVQTPPAQEAAPSQVELSPSDPAGMAAAMEQNMPALIQHLAQERFALTPEEVQELETDVTTAVPKLLAKVHLQSHIAMQKFLAQAVPGMIHRHTQVSQANSEAENKFFDTHKQLGLDKNNPQHRATAVRLAKMYRGMNPQAPLDQLIADIGPMVARTVGAQPGAVTQQTPQAPNTPVMARQQMPFRPAVNGGGSPVPSAAPVDDNPWGALGQDFD